MSTMVGFRRLHRSASIGVGSKELAATGATTLINIDNPRVARDLARHSTLGQLFPASQPFYQNDSGTVEQGGRITVDGLVASGTAVFVKSDAGVITSGAADTEALTAPVATNARIDLISVTLAAPQTLVETNGTAGTAASGVNAVDWVNRPIVPASSVALAYLVWPPNTASISVVAATNIFTLSNHGYTAGQKFTVATITTITTPAVGTVVYIKPIDANTFTVSTTPGGPDFDVTAADGSLTLNSGPTVIDARP